MKSIKLGIYGISVGKKNTTPSVLEPIFDFDFEETSKFVLSGSDVLSYTDRGITLLPYETNVSSNIQLQVDGVRIGAGTATTDGSCLATNYTNANINDIFLVVAQTRNGTSAVSYNCHLFSTRNSLVANNGVQVSLNSTPNVRAINGGTSGTLTSTLYRKSTALGDTNITGTTNTLSFGALNTFKVIRLRLTSHFGTTICLGKLFNGTGAESSVGGCHPIFKRALLYNCTQAEGDTIYNNLITQYSI